MLEGLIAALVVLGLYVLKQILSKLFFDPAADLRRVIDETAHLLAYHAPTIYTPIGRTKETSDAARDSLLSNSAALTAKLDAIRFYGAVRLLFLGKLPDSKSISEAAVTLRGLSTHMHETGEEAIRSLDVIHKRVDKIRRLLKIGTR
jgi:hypothetical protein